MRKIIIGLKIIVSKFEERLQPLKKALQTPKSIVKKTGVTEKRATAIRSGLNNKDANKYLYFFIFG